MSFFRVQASDPRTGGADPVDVLIEAEGPIEARNIAAAHGYMTGSVNLVEDPSDDELSTAIRKQKLPSVNASPNAGVVQVGPSVVQIAAGVFLGLTTFFICLAVVSCVAGGRVYIG
jgi:hypothetical protein